jgi:hypothetical protein
MEQEKTVEQEKPNVFVPPIQYTVSQTITLGSPDYLRNTQSVPHRVTRRTIFEYLKLLWIDQTDALTIAKRKRELGQSLYQREIEILNHHEGKCLTQNRWNNKSPFKRQRHN